MAAPRQISLRLLGLLALVPATWWLLTITGVLGRMQNSATDWMFLIRGEIPAYDGTKPDHPPLKIIYVDIDARAMAAWGDRPWSRGYFAQLLTALCRYGKPKAVGLDFILSPIGMKSELVAQDKARKGNDAMQAVMQDYPQVVLAAEYSNTIQPFGSLMEDIMKDAPSPDPANPHPYSTNARVATFPYLYKGRTNPKLNAYPESPTYPLIGQNYGTVGLLNIATQYNGENTVDVVPRWIPLFAETEGPEHSLNLLYGKMDHDDLTPDLIMGNSTEVKLLTLEGDFVLPTVQHETFYNLSLEMALRYLGLTHKNIERTDDDLHIKDDQGRTLLTIPLQLGQLVEVNWFSRWESPGLNTHVSAFEFVQKYTDIAGDDATKKAAAEKFFEQFAGSLVLIGPVDPIMQDIAPTPFDAQPVPKVGVYGNMLKTIFTGGYLVRAPGWANPLAIFILTALVAGLAMHAGRRAAWAKIGGVVLLGGYIFGVFTLFAHFDYVLPLIPPVGSALTTAFAGLIVRLLDEEKQRKRIKGMFGTYISPELVNRMVESGEEPKLGGEQLTISIFFSDVQGFSSFSEVLTPEKLVELMNEYLTAMTDILQAESGTLDKYIGDAVVAMFGAPIHVHDNALRGCVAACRMQKRLAELRDKWRNEGGKWPPIVHQMRTRIGLNTGPAVVGNMGSTSRFNYTMMGDDVNLGARLESGAKQFGVYTMCSEATMTACEKIEKTVLFRRLDRIKVKGRSTPVEVYDVTGLRAEAAPDTLRCIELFEKGLAAYFAQKWDEAIACFAEAEKLEPFQPGRDAGVEHNPSELMHKRCLKMKEHPPAADWDGVLEMKEK